MSDTSISPFPPGFAPMPPFGPFHELVGPIYVGQRGSTAVIGLRVEDKHRNRGAMMHGGMICMLADTAITWAAKRVRPPEARLLTTSLSVNLIGNAAPGDWVEAHVDIVKAGRRVVFSNCAIWCGDKRIASAMAQFQVMQDSG